MVAGDDPLVGEAGAFDAANYIPDGAALVVLARDDVDAHASAQSVVEGECALPGLRRCDAFQRFKNGPRVAGAQREAHDGRLRSVGAGEVADAG
jgi:hypothetical protein